MHPTRPTRARPCKAGSRATPVTSATTTTFCWTSYARSKPSWSTCGSSMVKTSRAPGATSIPDRSSSASSPSTPASAGSAIFWEPSIRCQDLQLCCFFFRHILFMAFTKSKQTSALTIGFSLFFIAASLLIADDYVALGTASRTNAVLVASRFDRSREALKDQLGIAAVTATGEDIYNGRCFACHMFDRRKVGPPYAETIPKYKGNKAELVSFILNPRKMNPAYPPMPNQGLKPVEADSVASYILRKIASTIPLSTK